MYKNIHNMANPNEQSNVARELYLVNIVRFFSLVGGAHLTLHSVLGFGEGATFDGSS